jgi:hypothetical protein
MIVAMRVGKAEVFTQFGMPTIVIRGMVVAILTVVHRRRRSITRIATRLKLRPRIVAMRVGRMEVFIPSGMPIIVIRGMVVAILTVVNRRLRTITSIALSLSLHPR